MTEVLSRPITTLISSDWGSQAAGPRVQTAKKLNGYGGAIDGVGLLEPCYLDTPIEELQQRLQRDGVVWVKGILDRDFVKKVRAEYFSFISQGTDMLKPGTATVDGIYGGADWHDFLLPGAVRRAAGLDDTGPFVDNAIASHSASFYQTFKDEVGRQLEPFVGKLGEFEKPWCLPRSLLRCSVPGSDSTPVHYDQIFLRAGPPTSVTAWVPMGDIEIEGGGLIYLDKSGDIGRKYEEDFTKQNAGLSDEERISAFNRNMQAGGWLDRNAGRFGLKWERRWLTGRYEAGDVVFHTPYAVHAGAMNEDRNGRIRVSTDLRFVDKSKPYDKRWEYIAYTPDDPNVARKASQT